MPRDGQKAQHEQRKQAAPAEYGVDKSAEAHMPPVGQIVQIIKDGPDVQQPLVPVRGIGVRGDELGVIVEHILLIAQHHVQIVPAENVRFSLGHPVGIIGEIIDPAGDKHKEHDAEERILYKTLPIQRPGAKAVDRPQKPDHRKTRPGIEAGPLAGRAQSEADTAQRQRPQPLLRDEEVHEQIHQQNKENGIGVDGGDAGLDKVHEVRCHQNRTRRGNQIAAEKLLGKIVQDRQHQHPEQRSGEAPAEGRHAEEPDPKTDDDLPEGRMRDLIGIDAVEMLPRGAGVIDLVKIAGIHEVLPIRAERLFVCKLRPVRACADDSPVFGQRHDLAQPDITAAADENRAAGDFIIQRYRMPFEHLRVALLKIGEMITVAAVGGVVDAVAPDTHACKQHQF